MRYMVLNRLYHETCTVMGLAHYRRAMDRRGWVPDAECYLRQLGWTWLYDIQKRREAWEERGPRNEDRPVTPNE